MHRDNQRTQMLSHRPQLARQTRAACEAELIGTLVARYRQFASLQQNGVPNGGGGNNCHQYCLKWNNHKLNVSGVFDRLRATQQFCDLTLSSADKRNIKCHRILLCAGSG